jgi:hypothetical protein
MSYKKVLGQVGSQVVDQYDSVDGFSSPIVLAIGETIDTGISDFTGTMHVSDGTDSQSVPCNIASGVQAIGTALGSVVGISVAEVAGSITIVNISGAEATISLKLS